MTEEEIFHVAATFGQAAARAAEAGLDGVQIHGAHGYLVSQFLTPSTNQRTDRWGGCAACRFRFLSVVIADIRHQVGDTYPVWIKLGVAGQQESGLHVSEGAQVALKCFEHGVDGIEISHALGIPEDLDREHEPTFGSWAETVRQAVGSRYPLALVHGFQTLAGMQRALDTDVVQLISLCRPLIAEPNLPWKLREGGREEVICVRCQQCWPKALGQGVACYNKSVASEE